jgi:HEPN domain-containing protein
MADPQIVLEWFKKADEDFNFASSVIKDSTFYAQICFHFHQAAEKYLKAYIIAFDLEFKKIHDLPVLLKSCLAIDSNLDLLLDDCIFLNRFYIDTRYPVHWPTRYNKDEALKAKKASENVRETLKNALKSIAPSL